MEVQFEPSLQAKLEQIARESGRANVDLIHDAVEGYVGAISGTREMLGSCYDDVQGGTVTLIPGDEEVGAHFRERSAAARRSHSGL